MTGRCTGLRLEKEGCESAGHSANPLERNRRPAGNRGPHELRESKQRRRRSEKGFIGTSPIERRTPRKAHRRRILVCQRDAGSFEAAHSGATTYRLVTTGTPVQNQQDSCGTDERESSRRE